MRKPTYIALLAGAAVTLTAGAAAAQGWMSIDQRQASLDARIDAGIRSGQLSRNEALSLRGEFRDLARLEARYRANGLSNWERSDLDRRFDQLAMRIDVNRHDLDRRGWRDNRGWTDNRDWFGGRNWTDNRGRWMDINRRQAQLDRRIDQGIRSGQLTRAEASRLRAEFHGLARLEARYRRGGLSVSERADLDRRFDILAQRIQNERRDSDRRYGYGYGDYGYRR